MEREVEMLEDRTHRQSQRVGDRQACVAREISKKFEEYARGTLSEVIALFEKKSIKGEIVVVVEGSKSAAKGNRE